MSATTNLISNLEHRLSHLLGEREAASAEIRMIEESVSRLSSLHEKITGLDKAIQAAHDLLQYDRPDWQPARVKAVRPRVWKSPFRSGEIGRTALGVLRENGGWMRPLDISRVMLDQINHDPDDRSRREKLTNTIAAYFKTHDGDLVESRGDYAKEWRVIR